MFAYAQQAQNKKLLMFAAPDPEIGALKNAKCGGFLASLVDREQLHLKQQFSVKLSANSYRGVNFNQ